MPDDRELDQLIDTALSTYAEPDQYLESRILAHLASQTSKPTRRWLLWASVLPIAACIALLLLFIPRHSQIEPIREAQQTQPAPQSTIAQNAEPPTHIHQPLIVAPRVTHIARKPAPLPKLDTFPGAHSLSPQELALVHFVANAPPSEIQAMQKAQQNQDQPLQIAAIVIQPIKPLDESEKEK
jgi:hypothetical protein